MMKLRFLGATQNVTGSRYVLEAKGRKFLVDCGLYQERQFRDRNWDPFAVPAAEIDAVLLTHAHLDHCGLLPKLVKEGFSGPIYCTPATADIARIVLADAGRLQLEDAKYKAKRHKREGRTGPNPIVPLYTPQDADAVFPMFKTFKYDQAVTLADGIEAVFQDAGHILGASSVRISVSENGRTRTVLFSGDIGQWDRPIIEDPSPFNEADYVLCESTYGDRLHGPSANIKQELCDVLTRTQEAGGNVVIPSFAVERCQEVLYYLNELLLEGCVKSMLVFVDSPMAVRVTRIFKKHPELFDDEMVDRVEDGLSPFELPGLNLVRTRKESQAINQIRGSAIIIAGSGMCTGGRIKYHLRSNITRPESTLLFVGYQAVGTLGRRIVGGEKEVRILGKKYPVKADVKQITGFSAHADRDELLKWLKVLKQPRHVFITHGEESVSASFAEYVHKETGWKTSVPMHGDEVILD
ncbi:MAG: MBL fold metallo-hydrolase [Planctomycetes bacterium]|nr:MBL fold metallo-hydrolase [Planctomycetota bacterium]